jgi:hypothetical protein
MCETSRVRLRRIWCEYSQKRKGSPPIRQLLRDPSSDLSTRIVTYAFKTKNHVRQTYNPTTVHNNNTQRVPTQLQGRNTLMAPYRILSLDGGGCRAIIESTVLSRLLETYPSLLEDVDLFAGASAGSILALCFAAGFSNDETTEFYEKDVKDVFKTTLIREFEVCLLCDN